MNPPASPSHTVLHLDRRANHALRAVVEDASELVLPYLEMRDAVGSEVVESLAYQAVREAYPELRPEDVHRAINAAARSYALAPGDVLQPPSSVLRA